jgi:hypothetical protein
MRLRLNAKCTGFFRSGAKILLPIWTAPRDLQRLSELICCPLYAAAQIPTISDWIKLESSWTTAAPSWSTINAYQRPWDLGHG